MLSRRVLVAGRGWAAVRTAKLLSMLAEAGAVDVTVECAPIVTDDAAPSWLPSLRAAAGSARWPVHDDVAAAELSEADVLLSVQYDRIVRAHDLHGARAYNLHFAPLPRHRGMFTSYWPLHDGDREGGVTLHVLVPAVDAGPIVAQRLFPIDEWTTAYDLYLAYHHHGFELLRDNLDAVLHGAHGAEPQDDTAASYHDRHSADFGALELDFADDAATVRDRCRALIFPPFQHPTFAGRPIVGCYAVDVGADAPPGQVLASLADEALVACGKHAICLELGERP